VSGELVPYTELAPDVFRTPIATNTPANAASTARTATATRCRFASRRGDDERSGFAGTETEIDALTEMRIGPSEMLPRGI